MRSANPNPKHNPEARRPTTSSLCRVATRGLPMALMSGGTPDSNINEPTKILALRAGATFWPGVDSESFGTPPTYRAYKIYASSSASMAVIDRSNLPLLDRAQTWPRCGCNFMQGLSRLRKRQSNRTDGLTPDKSYTSRVTQRSRASDARAAPSRSVPGGSPKAQSHGQFRLETCHR
jgi:hypothetical protein